MRRKTGINRFLMGPIALLDEIRGREKESEMKSMLAIDIR